MRICSHLSQRDIIHVVMKYVKLSSFGIESSGETFLKVFFFNPSFRDRVTVGKNCIKGSKITSTNVANGEKSEKERNILFTLICCNANGDVSLCLCLGFPCDCFSRCSVHL